MASEAEHIEAFRDAMRAAGVPYVGPIEPGVGLKRVHVEGDKKGTRNGWYMLVIDERPAGAFGTNRGDLRCTWSAKGTVPLTAEERERMAERQRRDRESAKAAENERRAAAAVLANDMFDAGHDAIDHPYLSRKGVPAYGLKVGDWIKTRRDDGSRFVAARNALLIPLRNDRKEIVSLQAIFAKPIRIGDEERAKDFVYGGDKKGCFFTIGRPQLLNGAAVILIVEGYATGASVHRATGHAVVVAFDAGNLLPVAEFARRAFPDAMIVICGDNDQWTKPTPEAPHVLDNPGLVRASQAAKAVGGTAVVPHFSDLEGKPTDWNDLDLSEGMDEVRRQVMSIVDPSPLYEPAPEKGVDPDQAPAEYAIPSTGVEQSGQAVEDDDAIDTGGYFRILGHDRDSLYVYQYEKRMITCRGDTDWSENAMVTLAPLHWWEMHFPGGGKDGGFNRKAAFNWLIRTAYKRGYFDPNSRRGRGAWRDDGRCIYHFGNKLWVDGEMLEVTAISSSYVYEQARRLRHPHASESLSGEDGRKIAETAKMFHWVMPASAVLLSGFVALAPICGALNWRPHIWITGGAGSGKSTILKEWLWPLMNGCCIFAQGNSTEAGIRQTLKMDSLPVLFDESEQNDEREEARVQAILALIRQASTESEARTLKGTAGGDAQDFLIRSMFCLSSVMVGMKHQADLERLTVLALKPKLEGDEAQKSAENWKKLSQMLGELRADAELPSRLMRRALTLLPVTMKNILVFSQAVAEVFGSQRSGDQYGTLLAGAWSLVSTREATLEDAKAMIARYDWGEYRESTETEESTKALYALLGRLIRNKGGDISVSELISAAAFPNSSEGGMDARSADAILRRHGLMVKLRGGAARGHLIVANKSHALTELMQGTAYAADLKGQLLRVPDAERHDKTERFAGEVSKGVAIPLFRVLDNIAKPEPGEPPPEDLPVDDRIEF